MEEIGTAGSEGSGECYWAVYWTGQNIKQVAINGLMMNTVIVQTMNSHPVSFRQGEQDRNAKKKQPMSYFFQNRDTEMLLMNLRMCGGLKLDTPAHTFFTVPPLSSHFITVVHDTVDKRKRDIKNNATLDIP